MGTIEAQSRRGVVDIGVRGRWATDRRVRGCPPPATQRTAACGVAAVRIGTCPGGDAPSPAWRTVILSSSCTAIVRIVDRRDRQAVSSCQCYARADRRAIPDDACSLHGTVHRAPCWIDALSRPWTLSDFAAASLALGRCFLCLRLPTQPAAPLTRTCRPRSPQRVMDQNSSISRSPASAFPADLMIHDAA